MEAGTVKKIVIGLAIPILLILLALTVAAIYFFVLKEPPERVLEHVVFAAQSEDEVAFKKNFSRPSLRALEGSWKGEGYGRSGSWMRMMGGILEESGAAPQIEEGEESEDGTRAKVKIRLRGHRRTVYFVKESSDLPLLDVWKIDVLSGVNVGVSEEARSAKKEDLNPEKQKKDEKFTKEPERKGWWKKGKDEGGKKEKDEPKDDE